jgi:hypothetical protein
VAYSCGILSSLVLWYSAVEHVRCNLYWERENALLIGWFDSVMLLEIKIGAGGRQIGTVMEWKVSEGLSVQVSETTWGEHR